MLVAVIDTETTGDGETDQVCEVAVVTVRGGRVGETRTQLIKPTCSVSPVARGVHHITDEELECEPTMTDLMSRRVSLLNIIKNADYVAGHFVDFDVRMLAQSGYVSAKPTVCTWKCARHMWPEAPAFGNQALRYWLNLNIPKMRHPPHRALTDAVVTAHILARMLATERTIDDLVTLTSAPVLLRTVSFGKYRGQTWREVRLKDRGYLSWLLRQDFGADERHTAEHWFKMTREEVDATGETGEVLQVRETAALDLPEETGRTAEGTVDGGPDIPEVPVHERVPRA